MKKLILLLVALIGLLALGLYIVSNDLILLTVAGFAGGSFAVMAVTPMPQR